VTDTHADPGRGRGRGDERDRERDHGTGTATEERRERPPGAAPLRTDGGDPGSDSDADGPPVCHYRDCDEPASFRVLERYQEETGHGLVTAEALMCRAHADDESPTNLDHADADYVFRVEPLPGAFEAQGDGDDG
jgi:hypothetical protein